MDIQSHSEEPVIPIHFELATMIESVSSGRRASDFRFDRIYPSAVRQFTRPHWTPFEVAIRAAELLVTDSKTRVLDVGSGAGKFCLIGAMTTPATFCGVEQRGYLVNVCRAIASTYRIPRVSFVHENMASLDWSAFNAFYFFNPFYENINSGIRMGHEIEFSVQRYERCIRITQKKLAMTPLGTRVVTYHGMGGEMPEGFVLVKREFRGTGPLELWIKERSE